MANNSIGHIFRLTTFGESHGKAIGGVIDGCPANVKLDLQKVQEELDRRKPGQSSITTQRKESDTVEFLSGILDGVTLGTPIGFIISNEDQKSKDYEHNKDVYRPSHADYTYQEKYGIRDHRGGGRSSARETACRVVAGAIAKQILESQGIQITSFVSQVGDIILESDADYSLIEQNPVRCPHEETALKMEALIQDTRKAGDTIGGCVSTVVTGTPVGLGEPVFDKLHAALGAAMLSINAAKGFEVGSGFNGVKMKGSEHNDLFESTFEGIGTSTNNSGGIQGGISNGQPIEFRVAFKPVATIMSEQETVDSTGANTTISGKGRHDPCVVPRAVPIVEAMTAIVLLDFYLRQRSSQI